MQKDTDKFHVFWGKEVADIMTDNLTVTNSKARIEGQFDNQKVVFKYENVTLGELEMRNDSPKHYREVRFNMMKHKVMKLLFENINYKSFFNDDVIVYGQAQKRFGPGKS